MSKTCVVDDCGLPWKARQMCGSHYQRFMRVGSTEARRPRGSLEERIWAKVDIDGPQPREDTLAVGSGQCWIWKGALNRKGYPVVGRGTRKQGTCLVHRAVYELLIGLIGKGLQLDHRCQVRNCVNPAHLEPVTAAVNMKRRTGVTLYFVRGRFARKP